MSDTDDLKGLDKAKARLRRLDRIRERDPLARFPGFDPETVRKLETKEIGTNPEGFRRRMQDQGLDRETKAELSRALRRKRG